MTGLTILAAIAHAPAFVGLGFGAITLCRIWRLM